MASSADDSYGYSFTNRSSFSLVFSDAITDDCFCTFGIRAYGQHRTVCVKVEAWRRHTVSRALAEDLLDAAALGFDIARTEEGIGK